LLEHGFPLYSFLCVARIGLAGTECGSPAETFVTKKSASRLNAPLTRARSIWIFADDRKPGSTWHVRHVGYPSVDCLILLPLASESPV
jgi:hypothetical protein